MINFYAKSSSLLERIKLQLEEIDYNAFNTKLARLLKKLKKDVGATKIYQGYKGTGAKKARRQIWIDLPTGKNFDLWLDMGFVKFGGVQRMNFHKPIKFEDTPEATYERIRDILKADIAG